MDALSVSADWDALVRAELGSAEAVDELRADLDARGVAIDGEPLCRVLRPHFMTAAQVDEATRVAAILAGAVAKVATRVHAEHRAGLQEWMADLLDAEPADAAPSSSLLRFDAFLARTHLHYVELNADSPGGAGHLDALEGFFASLPVYERFATRYRVEPQRACGGLLDALLRAAARPSPTVAVVQQRADAAHFADAELEAAHHRRRGVTAVAADPAELVFAGGRLRHDGRAIDVVHRAMPAGRCLELRDHLEPLLDALRARAVTMVNPFGAELLGHKALFALLTDPSTHDLLTPAERATIAEHVPWSRVLREALVPDVLARRERLVLKPAHGFGGRGVVLGWRVDDAAWQAAVEDGVREGAVVQARVEEHRVPYPALEPGLHERRYYEDADPFLFDGHLAAVLTRLSEAEITNVRPHTGGGVVPTFVLGSR